MIGRVGSTPLDDFLNESSSADTGELLQQIGLFGSLSGAALAAGLVVFLSVVHRGPQREVAVILRIIGSAGAIIMVGAAVEVAGVASIGDLAWSDALTDSTGSAPMMRSLGGLLVLLGLFEHTIPIGRTTPDETPESATAQVRWVPAPPSAFGFVGVAIALLSFWFDGHTVSRGPRVAHALVNAAHVSAGSIWLGGVVGLVLVGFLRRHSDISIAPLVIRFSAIASVALVVVSLAGAVMTLFIIDGLGDLTGTDWGRLLLVKTGAVAVTAAIGGYNHFVVVPALDRSDEMPMRVRARNTLAVEALVLAFVVAMTVFLTTASTN